jgi:hypothetical protein
VEILALTRRESATNENKKTTARSFGFDVNRIQALPI